MTSPPPLRFAKNAPGPFYTTGGCTACGQPEAEAPDLLAPLEGDNLDTYFVKQPTTPEEVERACRAVTSCCVSALRYSGTNQAIIRRLGNRPEYCDRVLPGGPVRYRGETDVAWQAVHDAYADAHRGWWEYWKHGRVAPADGPPKSIVSFYVRAPLVAGTYLAAVATLVTLVVDEEPGHANVVAFGSGIALGLLYAYFYARWSRRSQVGRYLSGVAAALIFNLGGVAFARGRASYSEYDIAFLVAINFIVGVGALFPGFERPDIPDE